MEFVIETEGLAKVYRGGTEALKGVDLRVPKGSCFGLLGPNGAGKSTLVKTLLGIVHASRGTARINGVDFRSPAARQGVGYLPEGHAFPPYLTGRGVCRYFGRLGGYRGPELEREIDEKLEWVGMSARADERVTGYSKGMKQRIGLAQALVGKPSLVFLDEPTDGLDPVGRSEIREVIRQVRSEGTTVFFNSHLLSEVEVICDELAILSRGELLRRGRSSDLMDELGGGGEEGLHVGVECGELPEVLWASLAERGAARREEGFSITLPERERIPALVDELREAGVPLYALRPARKSLETVFVDLIRGQEAAVAGAASPQDEAPATGAASEEAPPAGATEEGTS